MAEERFYPPPFSVLDTRKGSWQRRKNYWNRLAKANVVGIKGANRDGTMTGFDGALCEVIYTWFMPKAGIVLDPFAGGVTRGSIASCMGHSYYGVELRTEQISLNMAANSYPNVNYFQNDSTKFMPEVEADLIFTSPPYAWVERYSDDERDLSTMSYDNFLIGLRAALHNAIARLKNNRYAIIVMGEGARIKGFLPGLITDTHIILRDSGMKLYNEVILLQPIGDFRFGSMGNFEKRRKFTRIHQHVLIYSKGEPYISDLAA